MNISKADYHIGTIGIIKGKTVKLNIPGARVYLEPLIAKELESLVSYIDNNTHEEDPILVLPYEPMLYVLANRHNPTYFDGVFPITLYNQVMEESFIKRVEESGTKLVVFKNEKSLLRKIAGFRCMIAWSTIT
jgi:hypothetical protein